MKWHKADPLLFWSFVALSVAVVVPFWVVELLPLLDIPQHIATIGVMHHFGDPSWGYDQSFVIEAGSTQYLLYYVVCDWLAHIVGVENANKVFLSTYALLLPLSLLYFLHVFGRIRAAALLAFPLVFNKFLFYAFINYVFAIPFLFFGLALLKRALDDPETNRWRELLLLLCSLTVFYSHLQIFLVYVGGMGLLALMHWPGRNRFVIRLLHLLPAVILFALWARSDMAGGEVWEEQVSKRYASLTGSEWEPMWKTFREFQDRVLAVYEHGKDEWITLGLGAGILSLLMVRKADWRSLFPEALTLFVLAFYLAVPTSYKWIWPVNWRFAPLVVLLFLTWGRADLHRYARWAFTAAFATFSLWSMNVHIESFKAFDKEAATIHPILDAIEPQSRVMALMFDTGSAVVSGPAYLHFVMYHQIRNGGVSAYNFAEAPQSPVRFRLRRDGGPPPTALRSEWKANQFRFNTDARYYDYFLTRGERPGFTSRAQFPRGELKKITTSGKWTLYRLPREAR